MLQKRKMYFLLHFKIHDQEAIFCFVIAIITIIIFFFDYPTVFSL